MAQQDQPTGLERLLAFLNSGGVGFELGNDELLDVQAIAAFSRAWVAATDSPLPGVEQVSLLKQLRESLLKMVTDGADDETALATLNRVSAQRSFHYHFGGAQPTTLNENGGTTLTGVMLQAAATLLGEGNWNRLKICANPDCRAAFYDGTRGRSQRWHSYAMCGNKANVAAHRSRET